MTTKVANSDHPTYQKLEKLKKLMKELDIEFKYSKGEMRVIDYNVFGLKQEFVLVNGEDNFDEPFSNLKYFPVSEFKLKPFE